MELLTVLFAGSMAGLLIVKYSISLDKVNKKNEPPVVNKSTNGSAEGLRLTEEKKRYVRVLEEFNF